MINILVLCTGNSARSILGEAMINQLGAPQIRAFSAGSKPKGEPHPGALRLLAAKDIDIARAAVHRDRFGRDQAIQRIAA